MKERETVFVTGASGFIGGWIVETLFIEGKMDVRPGIRNWSSATRLARFPLEIFLCDVMQPEQIERAIDGATIVLHLATGSPEVIIQGTENMLEAALKKRVRRFVFLSSTAVYGLTAGEIDESMPPISMGWDYADAKIEAEKLCWVYHKKGLPVTIIRPPIVYGPFSYDWVVRFAEKITSGNWGLFKEYGEGICNLLYVSDAVSGIIKAATNDRAAGEIFNLSGPETTSWNDYTIKLNRALGLPELQFINQARSKSVAIFTDLFKALAKLILKYFENPIKTIYERSRYARIVMKGIELKIKTTASLSELKSYNRRGIIVDKKAREILNYQPRYGIEKGVELSVQWLKLLGIACPK